MAVLDLQAIATHNARWEPAEALAAARRCIAASRRFRLATLPKALVLGAAAAVLLERAEEAEEAMAEAVSLAPDDNHLYGETWGVRAYLALQSADDARALAHLERAVEAFRRRANEVTGSPAVGLWMLLRVATDTALDAAPAPLDPVTNRWNGGLTRFADAIALGRRGDGVAAAHAFAAADAELGGAIPAEWYRLQGRRVVTAAAIADRWGDPGHWAIEDLAELENRGMDRWAAALRGLLRLSGAVVPRRGHTEVPVALRALHVTNREADVLALVAQGRGNREIAERLFLSPRTVEKHVERLLAKTGLARRTELVAFGVRTLDRRSIGGDQTP